MRIKSKFFLIFFLFFLSLNIFASNTYLRNIAYVMVEENEPIYSNAVETVVEEDLSFYLISDSIEEIESLSGVEIIFNAHFILKSEVNDKFTFGLINPDGDYFMERYVLYNDKNKNGIPEDDEILRESDIIDVNPAEPIKLIVKAKIPKGLSSGLKTHMNLYSTKVTNQSKKDINYMVKISNYDMDESQKILIEKTTDRFDVEIGEIFKYKVKIKNTTDTPISKYKILDYLPRGIKLIENSIKVNNHDKFRLIKSEEGLFTLEIDDPSDEVEISYVVQVGVTTKIGKNTNRVTAYGYSDNKYFGSNMASADVEVDSYAFSMRGVIFGRVFVDLNKNNLYEKGDIPIPGAKIYLENGDYAITDKDGKYSIFGENSITHIAKIDMLSIPKGATPVPINSKYSKNGESAFADLKTAQLHKVNFAFQNANEDFIKNVESRKEYLETLPDEIENVLENRELEFRTKIYREDRIERENIIGGREELAFPTNFGPSLSEVTEETKVEEEKSLDTQLEEKIMSTDDTLDFMNVKDGDSVNDIMTFQVKGPRNGTLNIYINGKVVPVSKIGITASSQQNNVFFLEYNTVEMDEGKNKVKLVYSDIFGVERDSKTINLNVAGKYSDFTFEAENNSEVEIGQPVKIKLIARDKYGHPIRHTVGVSVETKSGRWVTKDIDTEKDGLQVISDMNGTAILEYIPSEGSQKVTFNINCEGKEKKIDLPISGGKRPIFFNGILEGRVDFQKFSTNRVNEDSYIFENALENFDTTSNTSVSERAAFFMKGNITDEYYLTLAYDNVQEDKKFFGYVDPEDYYPIYGDNSIRGYEAQSISNLYLKLERGPSYFLYGDYETDEWEDEDLEISTYSRILNGGVLRYDGEKLKGGGFASKTSSEQFIEEFRGGGVSGPYKLKNRDIIEGSEKVEIIVYKRNNPNIILERKELSRFTDYTLDIGSGQLYFSRPVPGTDLDFNPIYIRVSYEVDEDISAEKRWVYGADLQYSLTEWLSIGTKYVKDDKEVEKYSMNSYNMKINFLNGLLITEFVQTDSFEYGIGEAWGVKYEYIGDRLEAEATYSTSNENFSNESSAILDNQDSLEVLMEYQIFNGKKLILEGDYIKDKEEQSEEKELYIGIENLLGTEFVLDVGVRHFSEKNGRTDSLDKKKEKDDKFNTIGSRLTWKPTKFENFDGFIEYEQDILEPEYKRLGLGMNYRVFKDTIVYYRQEFFSNLGEDYAIEPEDEDNKSIFGIESGYFPLAKVFSEYRVVNEDEGTYPEVGSGLKTDWEPFENLKFYGTFEKITPMSNQSYEEDSSNLSNSSSTALTFGYNYKINETTRTTGDFEFSWDDTSSFLSKLGFGKKITESLSLLAKNRYYNDDDLEKENRFILGIAYRDEKNDKYNSLNKYELNYEKNIREDNYNHRAHILRSSHNYQWSRELELTYTFSGKYVQDKLDDISSNYFGYLMAAGTSYDITEKINLGINGAIYTDKGFETSKYGVGVEAGYLINSNIWLSVGYNLLGFEDDDFDPNGSYRSGVYMRFRMNMGDFI